MRSNIILPVNALLKPPFSSPPARLIPCGNYLIANGLSIVYNVI